MKKTVLITGGSSGLGLATTREFRDKGATVIVASRNLDKFERNLGQQTENLVFIETDFNDMASINELYKRIEKDFPELDIAINNIGSAQQKPLTETTEADFDYSINVNLKSLWLGLKYQILLMQKDKNREKHIINVSSINGLGGAEYLSIYASAKAGVLSLTKSASLETAGTNISINAIVPGPFETPMFESALDAQSGGDDKQKKKIKEQYKNYIPQGRFGNPVEFAKTILWLCEGNSKYISGHSLIIDGGMSSRFR